MLQNKKYLAHMEVPYIIQWNIKKLIKKQQQQKKQQQKNKQTCKSNQITVMKHEHLKHWHHG